MTPNEKAIELIDKFSAIKLGEKEDGTDYYLGIDSNEETKQCALICVDEIIKATFEIEYGLGYWQEVKIEIEKL